MNQKYNNFGNYYVFNWSDLKRFEEYLYVIKRNIKITIEVQNYWLDYIHLAENWKGLRINNLITFITFLPYSSVSNDPPKVRMKCDCCI